MQAEGSSPFFIVGAVRSGTTMLRDILRMHPRLECPEETHFFRWPDPFGTPRFQAPYKKQELFKKHREMDGVSEEEFFHQLDHLDDRRALMDWYGEKYLEAVGNPQGRWFDKTPQNVFGMILISEFYPAAKFIHIHRNPLNVVASTVQGVVIPELKLRGGVNYWLESLAIINGFKKISPDRVLEIKYEKIVRKPAPEIDRILGFVGEDSNVFPHRKVNVHPEKNKYKKVLNKEQIAYVLERTESYRTAYGYV